ncbi:MAG: carbon-nitrogen hydrolase family protein [Boseongicola sp.]|nr:carbon-nitrogen hydrolase family protein [Silicimonas sp.]NNL18283.1 carbon-nitrogen hydrolase family protein [Boseongicola sp.]
MRAALIQLNSSDDPDENLVTTQQFVDHAADGGAEFVLTPEVTNCVSTSRTHQRNVLKREAEDQTLAELRATASRHGIWLLIGSLALKSETDDRFVNRSFLVDPAGEINARYDKIHMFDVDISETETYRESDGYRAGDAASMGDIDGTKIGLTICYDVRFPYLYRGMAKSGAQILTVPSAFSPETGKAHWEPLLRARAIETGSFVLAPAQCGAHKASRGKGRSTYGHSLAVDPWGRVLVDGGDLPGVSLFDLDLTLVDDVRRRLPSLLHERQYKMV